MDAVVIGAGLNGLVAATVLARRKLSTLVLERRPVAGGAALSGELAAGFKAPTLSHAIGPLHADVLRAIRLDRSRVEFITPDPALTAFGRDGRFVVFHRDPVLTAGSIDRVSPRDAGRWREFLKTSHKFGEIVNALNRHQAPSIDDMAARDWWRLIKVGRQARHLGRRDLAHLVRWLPMPVADLTSEWFENDVLRAAISARAVFGNFAGPRSAGTGGILLQRLAEDALPVGAGVTVRGGPGALAAALVAEAERAGAKIRTGVRVARLTADNGRVTGVVLEDGEEIPATTVVSAIDPKQTFLELVDAGDLPPTFRDRAANFRARGVTAKINLALAATPPFPALHGDAVPLGGRFLIAPDTDYLERAFDAAKYGDFSPEPWLEFSLPTVADPSLAPEGRHVMSIYVHVAPRQLRQPWADAREPLYRAVLGTLQPYVGDLTPLVMAREILTPEDLERDWGLSGGHIFHGEPTLDQSWLARPLLGWAQYRTPINGLYLASAGTHPGGGLNGLSGLHAARAVLGNFRLRT
jgi:phytoene dehydrogenase-like protein